MQNSVYNKANYKGENWNKRNAAKRVGILEFKLSFLVFIEK